MSALTFKALRYNNNSTPITLKETSFPEVTKTANGYDVPDETVLVKVHYAALNPMDCLLRNSTHRFIFRGERGYGCDYSGEVVAIGASAAKKTGLAVGDKVNGTNQTLFGAGTAAEYTLVDPFGVSGSSIRKTPENLTYAQAAAYPLTLGTAQTFFYSVPKENALKKVLVLGAGTSIGRYVVQLAKKIYNVEEVTVTCSANSAETLKALGADKIIDYTQYKSILQPTLESVKETGKFDAVFDCCGNADLFTEIQNIIKGKAEGGFYGTVVGDATVTNNSVTILRAIRGRFSTAPRILATKLGYYDYHYGHLIFGSDDTWADKAVKYQSEFGLVNSIDSEWPKEEFQKALDRINSNHANGKVLIKFSD